MNTTDSYIVKAGIVFDTAIIKGEIAINGMSAVLPDIELSVSPLEIFVLISIENQ